FTKVYDLPNEYSYYKYFHLAVGHCGDTEFICSKSYEDEEALYIFRFNCNKRNVEKYAESRVAKSDGIIISVDLKNMSIVIKDKKDSKDMSYKFYKSYASSYEAESLKKENFKKGDNVNFEYATIDGEKIIIGIWRK
ncbi:MAG: hypothetical protein FWG49_01660, partial [Leptospirales bacterium]|nr:hypothetical protein [Leptospirales bacterium]